MRPREVDSLSQNHTDSWMVEWGMDPVMNWVLSSPKSVCQSPNPQCDLPVFGEREVIKIK